MYMKTSAIFYISPKVRVMDLDPEGVICASKVETDGVGVPYVNPFVDSEEQIL